MQHPNAFANARRLLRGGLVFGVLTLLPLIVAAQTPCSPVANPSVAWNYQPSGGFYSIVNFVNWPFVGDNPRADADDQFNFTTGELHRLYEAHGNRLQDIRYFRVPSCIQPR